MNITNNDYAIIVRNEISIALLKSGLSPAKKGFEYLKQAVFEAVLDNTKLKNMAKNLYPIISDYYNTNNIAIERAIRFCMNDAIDSNRFYGFNEVMELKLFYGKNKFCVSKLIGLLAEGLTRISKKSYDTYLEKKSNREEELNKEKARLEKYKNERERLLREEEEYE